MYVVCLIFATLSAIGCVFVTILFISNGRDLDTHAFEAARRINEEKMAHNDHNELDRTATK